MAGDKGGGVICPPFSRTAAEMVTWAWVRQWGTVRKGSLETSSHEAESIPGASAGFQYLSVVIRGQLVPHKVQVDPITSREGQRKGRVWAPADLV